MPANLENSAVATGLEKVSFHSYPKKGNARECSNYRTIALISHASKVMLRILQARLQQYMNCGLPVELFWILKDDAVKALKFSKPDFNSTWAMNLQMFTLDLEKAKEPEIKLPTSVGSSKKQESCRKSSTSAFLTVPKPLCGSQQIVENSSRDGNSRPSDLTPKISV